MWPLTVIVTGGRLLDPSASITSSGIGIPVAVFPPSSTVLSNLILRILSATEG